MRRLLPPVFLFSALLAACGGDSRSPTTTEQPARAARVVVSPSADTLTWGSGTHLEASVYDSKGALMSGVQLEWVSSDQSVLRVSASGDVETVGVGEARITARVQGVAGSADLVVQPRVHAIHMARADAQQYAIVQVLVPDSVAAVAAAELGGTVGESAIAVGVLDPRTLAFTVPLLQPATYPVRVELNANEQGTFQLTVTEAPPLGDIQAAGEAVLDSADVVLEEMVSAAGEPEWAEYGFDAARIASVQATMAEARAQFATLTPEEKERVVRFLREAGLVDNASGSYVAGDLDQQFEAFWGQVVRQKTKIARTIAKCAVGVGVGALAFGAGAGVVAAVCGGVLIGDVMRYWKTVETHLENNVYNPVGLGLSSGSSPAGQVSGAAAVTVPTFRPEGSSQSLSFRVQLQTLDRSAASGPAGKLFAAIDEVNAGIRKILSLLPESLRPTSFFDGSSVQQRSDWASASGTGKVELLGTSSDQVSCTWDNASTLTCRATSEEVSEDISFEARFRYSNSFGSANAQVGAVVAAVAPVASVELTPTSASMPIGQTQQLTATTKDASGNTLSDRTITWTSSNQAVATVSASGLVTGVAVGSATISATSEGQSATATITVSIPVASLELRAGSWTWGGKTEDWVGHDDVAWLSALDKNGNELEMTGRTIAWESSDSAVAEIGAEVTPDVNRNWPWVAKRRIHYRSPGAVTLRATVDGVSAEIVVHVYPDLDGTKWEGTWELAMDYARNGKSGTHVFKPTSKVSVEYTRLEPPYSTSRYSAVVTVVADMETLWGPRQDVLTYRTTVSPSGEFNGPRQCDKGCTNLDYGFWLRLDGRFVADPEYSFQGTIRAEVINGDVSGQVGHAPYVATQR